MSKAGGKTPRVGDVVAIPAGGDERVLAVVVAKNAFGVAYGIFEGRFPEGESSPGDAKPRPRPIYSGDESVKSGRWKIVGHDDALRERFPANPEIYHRAGDATGPHGAAETADGDLREISAEEAREVGLEDGSYRQVLLPDDLERLLTA